MSTEQNRRIEKLKKQVERAESKGNMDSAHHEMLRRELAKNKPVEGVTPRKARKGIVEDDNGE